jgi:hypothetical protein
MHIVVVEALLVAIYLPEDEQILIDTRRCCCHLLATCHPFSWSCLAELFLWIAELYDPV